jgi:hypothetical protein
MVPNTTNVSIVKHGNGTVAVWPNPAKQLLNVQIEGGVQYKQLGLYDQLGRLVYGSGIERGQTFKSINIGNVANGVYYLRLTGDYGSETKKVIIQQQ